MVLQVGLALKWHCYRVWSSDDLYTAPLASLCRKPRGCKSGASCTMGNWLPCIGPAEPLKGIWGLNSFLTALVWLELPLQLCGEKEIGPASGWDNSGQIIAVRTTSGMNLDGHNKASSKTCSTQDLWPGTFPIGQVPLPLPKEKKKEKT